MTMRALTIALVLHSVPVFAANYSPWPGVPGRLRMSESVELAQQEKSCCRHCSKGQPCENTCISAKSKCKSPPGCAC